MKKENIKLWLFIIIFLLFGFSNFYNGWQGCKKYNIEKMNYYIKTAHELDKQGNELLELAEKQNIYLELGNMRCDIYKRQIKNLQAEVDGLRTIIGKDPTVSFLIDWEENE